MVAVNTGAWLPCGTDGKPGYATDGLVNGPRASRGSGATGCAWRIGIFLWGYADAYPGRGCGRCIDAAGGGSICFASTSVCEAPPLTVDSAIPIGAFGICPANIPLSAGESAAVPTDDTGGAWSLFYVGPVPSFPGLGTVHCYRCVRVCYSGNTTPPTIPSCNFIIPSLSYDPDNGCHEDFGGRLACEE